MIIDTLDNLEKYAALNPLFPKVVEFLKANDLSKMADGKYEIEGKDLFVNITTTKGKTPDEAFIETHNKMIDIQIPITAAETYGKIPDLAADSYVTCQPGMMAIFFPQDGHAPCIAGVPEFKKAIFKVKA